MKPINDYTNLSQEEVNNLELRIYTYKKIIDQVQNCLMSGEIIAINSDEIELNKTVVYIAPNIEVEYKNLLNQELEFETILDYYESWLDCLSGSVLLNQEKILKNKALKNHWIAITKICLTVYKPILIFFKKEK